MNSFTELFIETPRLILRSWKESDISEFIRMNGDDRVMRYFLNALSEEESIAFYERICKEIRDFGFGLLAVERKSDGKFIGFTGLHTVTFDMDFTPAVEIGWRLLPEYQGQGYATEAAKECLVFARDKVGIKEVYSFTSMPNKASERVMQKIGMTFIKEFDHPLVPDGNKLKRHLLYKIALQ